MFPSPRALPLLAALSAPLALAAAVVGTPLGWGAYSNGDTPPSATNLVAVQASGQGVAGLREDGTVLTWPGTPTPPPGLSNVVELLAGEYLFAARKADGTVVVWGGDGHVAADIFRNPPPTLTKTIALAAGSDHLVAWTPTGEFVAWGANYLGALAVPGPAQRIRALDAGQQFTVFLDESGRLRGWGTDTLGCLTFPVGFTDGVQVSASHFNHALALRSDGRVFAWGNNSHGQVAPIGTTFANFVQVAAGRLHSAALRADGSVHVWGGRGTRAAEPAPAGVRFSFITASEATIGLTRAPVPIAPWQSLRVFAGRRVTLERPVIGSEPWTLQWLRNNEPIPGATNATLTLPNPQNENVGLYTVAAANVFGTNTSLALDFSIDASAPFMEVQPSHVAVPPGQSVRLVARAVGTDPIAYQWFHRGQPIPGQTWPTLDLPNATASNDGPYYVVATNENGSATSEVAFLSTGRPILTVEPSHAVALPGRPVRLSAAITTPEPTTLQWFRNQQPLPDATQLDLDLGPALPGLTADYHLVASNASGSVTSRLVHVHVRTPPAPASRPHLAVHPYRGALPYPPEFDRVLDARMMRNPWRGTFGMAITPEGKLVTWTANPSLHASLAPPDDLGPVSSLSLGVFHALARDASGTLRGWHWNEAENYGQSFPPAEALGAFDFASGDKFSIGLQPDGSVVQWPIQGSAYPSQLRRAALISVHQSTVMVAHEDGTLLRWDPQYLPVQSSPSVDAVAIWAGAAGGVVVRSDGTLALLTSDGLTPLPPLPGGARAVEAGGSNSEVLALDASGRVWQRPWNTQSAWGEWLPGLVGVSRLAPGQDGTYALTTAPFFSVLPSALQVALGSATSLVAEVRSPSPVRLQWLRSGQPIPGANQSTLDIPQASYADDADYALVAANDLHSITSAPVRVGILGPPLLLGPDRVAVAAGDDLALRPEFVGVGPFTNAWRRDAVFLPDATGPALVIPNAQARHAGVYYLDSTNAFGGSRGGPYVVAVVPSAPRWTRSPVGRDLPAGARLVIAADARGSEPISWQWYRDDQPVPGANGPVLVRDAVTPEDAGEYVVRAVNALGTIASTPARVTVNPSGPRVPEASAWRVARAGTPFAWAPDIAGSAPLSIQWRRNGEVIEGATNAVLSFPVLSETHAGSYTIHLSNPLGQAASAPMDLVVRPATPAGAAVAWALAGPSAELGLVRELALGPGFALGLRTNGTVALWSPAPQPALAPPADLDRVVAIAAGETFGLALRDDGSVRAWGTAATNPSVLKVPDNLGRVVSIAAGYAHAVVLIEDGTVRAWGSMFAGSTNPPSSVTATPAVEVASGGYQAGFIRRNGTVATWGGLGTGFPPSSAINVVSLALGKGHGIVARTDGRLVSWGHPFGPLNPPNSATNIVRVAAGASHSLVLRANGTVLAWGSNLRGQTSPPVGLSNVVAVFANGDLSAAITRAPGLVPNPASLVLESDATLRLGGPVASASPAAVQWLRNGVPLPGATNDVLVAPALEGSYVLRASNAWQTVQSAPTVVRTVGPIEWRWHEPAPGQRAVLLRAPRATKARFLASTNLLDWTVSDPVAVPAEGVLWTPAAFPGAPAVFLRPLVE